MIFNKLQKYITLYLICLLSGFSAPTVPIILGPTSNAVVYNTTQSLTAGQQAVAQANTGVSHINAITAFVSDQYGNDSNAIIGQQFSPYKTVLAAYNALNGSSVSAGNIERSAERRVSDCF